MLGPVLSAGNLATRKETDQGLLTELPWQGTVNKSLALVYIHFPYRVSRGWGAAGTFQGSCLFVQAD